MIQQQAGAPTMIQYSEFDKAFDFLNGALFGGELPKVLVTFSRKPCGCLAKLLSRPLGADQL